MQWSATDQFGNLYIGVSDSATAEDLRPELESMIEELRARTEGPIKITLDPPYGEINGPDPERVSHLLQVGWLVDCDREAVFQAVSETVEAICADAGVDNVSVALAS